jgi:3-polyprenyl-4-hydroxybenzoate decarboxylase
MLVAIKDKQGKIFQWDQPGSSLDSSAHQEPGKKALTAKAGIDATIPFGKTDKSFKKERYGKIDLKKYL